MLIVICIYNDTAFVQKYSHDACDANDYMYIYIYTHTYICLYK